MLRVKILLLFLFLTSGMFSQEVETLTFHHDSTNVIRNWQLYLVQHPRDIPFSVSPLLIKESRFKADSSLLKNYTGVCWFRKVFRVDSTFRNRHLMLKCAIIGASEIYLDRKKIKTIGLVGDSNTNELLDNTDEEYAGITLRENADYELLIRYSNHDLGTAYNEDGEEIFGIKLSLKTTSSIIEMLKHDVLNSSFAMSFLVFFATLSFVHFTIFLYYREEKSNLFYSLFCLFISAFIISALGSRFEEDASLKNVLNIFIVLAPLFAFSLMPFMFRSFFRMTHPKWYFIIPVAGALCITLLFLYQPAFMVLVLLIVVFGLIESTRVMLVAVRKKIAGAPIIGFGLVMFVITVFAIIISSLVGKEITVRDAFWGILLLVFLVLSVISIPVSITILLARNIAGTNKSLAAKLAEVERLSARALEHEKEKQQFLQDQNVILEVQVEERTQEIRDQKKIIEEKNKELIDSINYARRIQLSLLPTEKYIARILRRKK